MVLFATFVPILIGFNLKMWIVIDGYCEFAERFLSNEIF